MPTGDNSDTIRYDDDDDDDDDDDKRGQRGVKHPNCDLRGNSPSTL